MQDEPTPEELTKAVADFLRNDIAQEISGHSAFKLRVAVNVLDLVTRQLKLGQGSDAAEAARLTRLLGMEGSLIELNRALSDKIAARTKEYEDRFLSPFIAAERGYIDDVIMPHSTRRRIARALAMLRDKHVEMPMKKHDNLPL
jgi:hypothetical protein